MKALEPLQCLDERSAAPGLKPDAHVILDGRHTRLGHVKRLKVFLENELLDRVDKHKFAQVASVSLGPIAAAGVMMSVAQQKGRQALLGACPVVDRIRPRAAQVTDDLVVGIGYMHRRQVAGTMKTGQLAGIALIGLDPVAALDRDQRGRDYWQQKTTLNTNHGLTK